MSRTAHAHKEPAAELHHEEAAHKAAAEAKREFASITITQDHLSDITDRVVVKCVLSTESAQESLLSQLSYFGQTALLTDPGILGMAHEGLRNDVIYVYTPSERQSNIIVDGAVWTRILEEAGTILEAVEQVVLVATDLQRKARAEGSDPRLVCFVANPAA